MAGDKPIAAFPQCEECGNAACRIAAGKGFGRGVEQHCQHCGSVRTSAGFFGWAPAIREIVAKRDAARTVDNEPRAT